MNSDVTPILARRLLLAGFLMLSPFTGGLHAAVPLDRIIAIVNSDVIMQSELNEKLRTVRNQLEQQGTQLPPQEALEKQVLERLIQNRLQLQQASETGIRVDDETLNRTISNIAADNKVTLTQFREILEKDGYSYERFREDIRDEITISRLRQRQVENRITVTDQEIDNFLATQEHQGNIQTEMRLAHILIATPDAASPEEIEQTRLVAEKVREDLVKGQDFAQMAASVSDGQQALDGGDLGWRRLDQVPTLFSDQVASMQKGDISSLIQSPSGFHIIKLVDVRSGDKLIVQQTHARHILIRTDELVTDEIAKTKLEQLKLRIEGGDDFAALAKAHSGDSVSAIEGGDLGWVNPGELVPQFESVMNSLQPGTISEPFQTDFGWHIVQVLERREHDSTETMKRAKAREAIRNRKMNEAVQNWLRQMRDEAYVEYRIEGY